MSRPELSPSELLEGLNSSMKALLKATRNIPDLPETEIEMPPPIDLGGADYLIALDDSGGIEPLLDASGNFKVAQNPFVVICAYGLPSQSVRSFNKDWNELRTHIKQELNAAFLPPIHMRVMYGRSLPEKLRSQPNPYKSADFHKHIVPWLNYSRYLIGHYSRGEQHHIDQLYFGERQGVHSMFTTMMTRTKLWKDLRYLRRTRKKYHKFTLARLSSPLPILLAFQLGLLNETLKNMRKTAVVVIDSFDSSQGVSALTVQQVVTRLGFTQIKRIHRAQTSDDVPLIQAADALAWFTNRNETRLLKGERLDDGLFPFMLDGTNLASHKANRDWDFHPFVRTFQQTLLLQYAVFREAVLETKSVRPLANLLVGNEEFEARVLANASRKRTRLTMFVDESLSTND